jgi:WD repeat-containing protein 48
MLRIKKVATYIAEKLDMQLPRSRDDSIVASRRPSLAPGLTPINALSGAAAAADSTSIQEATVPAHEILEILCEGVVLSPSMTLAQSRRFLWKQSGDLKLEYRMRASPSTVL